MPWGRGGEGRVNYRPDNGTRGRRRRPGCSLRTGRARGAGLERELERLEQGREREPGDAAPPMVGPPGPSAAPSSSRRRGSLGWRAGPSAGPQWHDEALGRGRADARTGGRAGGVAPVRPRRYSPRGVRSPRRGAAPAPVRQTRPEAFGRGPGAPGRARLAGARPAGGRAGRVWVCGSAGAGARGVARDVTAVRRRSHLPRLSSIQNFFTKFVWQLLRNCPLEAVGTAPARRRPP